jgi:hypothetical protein
VLVADLLSITDRAVRLACSEGRLEGQRVRNRWQISREAADN